MIEGHLYETSGGGGVAFQFKDVSFLKKIFGSSGRKIKSYACLHCSHLELMVDFTDKDRKRYQEFEGPQPGVLDRIGTNTE